MIVLTILILMSWGLARLVVTAWRASKAPGARKPDGARWQPVASTANDRTMRRCVKCEAALSLDVQQCPFCGWQSVAPLPGLADLEVTTRQLGRLHAAGLLDQDTYQRVQKVVDLERLRLMRQGVPVAAQLVEPLASGPSIVPPTTPAPADLAPALPAPTPITAEMLETPAIASAATTETSPAPPAAAVDPAQRIHDALGRRADRDTAISSQEARLEQPPPTAPRERSKPFAQLLAAFLEEKNIRWGELVGGLLIVGCSIALVLSFWSAIAEQPLLKFGVFNGVTAALFGMGLFIVRHWKLPTTGQGVLLIATLLVPLNMLAIGAMVEGQGVAVLTLAGEIASVGWFACLVFVAGRVLVPRFAHLAAIGVMGPAVLELVIARHVSATTNLATLLGLAAVPIACYLGVACAALRLLWRLESLDEDQATTTLKLLGMTTFSSLLPLGLLVARTQRGPEALSELSPLLSLACGPSLAMGLLLWRRVTAPTLVGLRTASSAVAVLGALALVIVNALALPQPGNLLCTGALSFLVLAAVAATCRIPAAALPGLVCLGLAWLAGWHIAAGNVTWHVAVPDVTAQVYISAASGRALLPFAILVGLAAQFLGSRHRETSQFVLIAAGVASALGLALVTRFGFGVRGDPEHASWIYAVYALCTLAFTSRLRQPALTWVASGLALAAWLQGIVFDLLSAQPATRAMIVALLAHAGLSTLAVLAARIRGLERIHHSWLIMPFRHSALAAAAAVLPLLAFQVPTVSALTTTCYLLSLCGIWLVLACLEGHRFLFTFFQAALALVAIFGAVATVETRDWFVASAEPWLDPWTIQCQGIALAGVSLAWSAVRLVARRGLPSETTPSIPNETLAPNKSPVREMARHLLFAPRARLDRVGTVVVLVGLIILASYAVLPGVAQELSPRLAASASAPRIVPALSQFELPNIPHAHAQGAGTWWLAGALLVVLFVNQWERFEPWAVLGKVVACAAVCFALAACWEHGVATASALRWLCTAFLIGGSVPIWFRAPLGRMVAQFGWPEFTQRSARLAPDVRTLVITLSLLPLVAMALHTGAAAVTRFSLSGVLTESLGLLGVMLVGACILAIGLRVVPDAMSRSGTWPGVRDAAWPKQVSTLVAILGAAPFLALLLYAVCLALGKSPILGPNPDTFFAQVGLAVSYAVPVLATAVVFVLYALRERSAGFAFAGGLVFNAGVTAAYLLTVARSGLKFDAAQWARLAQLNAIASAIFALGWTAMVGWSARRKPERSTAPGALWTTQVLLSVALIGLVLLAVGWSMFDEPDVSRFHETVCGAWGWAAFLLAWGAYAAYLAAWRGRWSASACVALLFGASVLVACSVTTYQMDGWAGMHAWLALNVFCTVLLLGGFWVRTRRGAPTSADAPAPIPISFNRLAVTRYTALTIVLNTLLVLRVIDHDFRSPAWCLGALLAEVLLASALAMFAPGRRFLYLAGLLWQLAANIWWLSKGEAWLVPRSTAPIFDGNYFNLLAMALPVVVWLRIELRVLKPALAARNWSLLPFHRLSSAWALGWLTLLVLLGLAADLSGSPQSPTLILTWCALASTAVAVAVCLADPKARFALASLYNLGLVAVALGVDGFNRTPREIGWTFTMILAAYSVFASYLWSRRDGLARIATSLGLRVRESAALATSHWLVVANGCLATIVLVLAFWVDLEFAELGLRLAAGKAALAQALAIGMLARGERRFRLQVVALGVAVVGAIAWSWAWLEPGTTGTLINRSVVAAVVLCIMTIVFALGLGKFFPQRGEWSKAATSMAPGLSLLTAASLMFVLASEVWFYIEMHGVPIAAPAIAAMSLALLGLAVAALVAAVVPGRDPLGLSERQRMRYVYGAEVVLGLLCLHFRITMPWLFTGFFERYWPLVVMFLAFLGAGLAELFRRQNRLVLAEPLERTGAFLPLLPLLGFWVLQSPVDYSLLLLTACMLYASLSIARRSFIYALVSALTANGALWFYLHGVNGWGFLDHPQLWLIPPAVSVMAASWLNRQRLSEAQQSTLRYLSSTTIYVSSTADIFIHGVKDAPWLPVVLAGISIVGILAGIALRVRAFLYLGASFLVLSLCTIIWHAAVDLHHTWLVWATGFVTGVLILALFGLFERKRHEVLRLVEQLKEWKA